MSWRAVLILALLGLALCGPVTAGVVEDAEEALQTVPSDNPARRPLDGTSGSSNGSSASSSSYSSSSSSSALSTGGDSSGGSRRAGTRRVGTGSGSGSAGAVAPGDVDASATPPVNGAARQQRQEKERADNTMSLLGILLLVALVVAAGLYSRRVGNDD